jgi:TRAP-type C4-dicarboxylate transport system permease small subunit
MFFFSLLLPGLVALFDRNLARTISTDWLPEGSAVVAAAFMGWFYAATTILLAVLARFLAARFFPKLLCSHDS